jgi:MFS family permease
MSLDYSPEMPIKRTTTERLALLGCIFVLLFSRAAVIIGWYCRRCCPPTIVNDLQISDNYVWVANSFWIAGTVLQPLFAQMSDLFGRKIPLLASLAIFFAGGAITGAVRSGSALIAGRGIQGVVLAQL